MAENALATLLGVPAGEFKIAAGRLQDRVQIPAVPAGLPLELLARRPDIVAAEFRVLESHNLVGQAKLAQLPSISLTGRGGTASFALGDLLKSFTFGLLPSINIPAFDPGIKARAKTSEEQVTVAEQEYRRTVIAAFEEVENASVNLDAHRQQKVELQHAGRSAASWWRRRPRCSCRPASSRSSRCSRPSVRCWQRSSRCWRATSRSCPTR